MTLGKLGLPLPVEPAPNHAFRFQVFPTKPYYDFAREHEIGKKMRATLLADSRYLSIDRKRLNNGMGATNLHLDHLVGWYVFRANEVGLERADIELDIPELAEHRPVGGPMAIRRDDQGENFASRQYLLGSYRADASVPRKIRLSKLCLLISNS